MSMSITGCSIFLAIPNFLLSYTALLVRHRNLLMEVEVIARAKNNNNNLITHFCIMTSR